jgi:hypothetical protein
MAFDLTGYKTVAQRLTDALERWPELRIQETPPKIVHVGDATYIEITTWVWRTPDDPMPAVASCWERWPGTTPYTRDSEQQNASTSSLGRALGLMGLGIDAGMATADEVNLARSRQEHPANGPTRSPQARNLQPVPDTPPARNSGTQAASEKQLGFLKTLANRRGVTIDEAEWSTLAADKRACSRKIEELNQ